MRPLYEIAGCNNYVANANCSPASAQYALTMGRRVLYEHEVIVHQTAVIRPVDYKTEIIIIEADQEHYTLDIGQIPNRKYTIIIRALRDTLLTLPAGLVLCGNVQITEKDIPIKEEVELLFTVTGSKEDGKALIFVDIPGYTSEGSIIDQTQDMIDDAIEDVLAKAMAYTDKEIASSETRTDEKVKDAITVVTTEYKNADDDILLQAKKYTDDKIIENDGFDAQAIEAAITKEVTDRNAEDQKLWDKLNALESCDCDEYQKKLLALIANYNKHSAHFDFETADTAIMFNGTGKIIVGKDNIYHNSTTTEDNKVILQKDIKSITLDDGRW